ncbi:hypothetical protein [Azospirillum brasilense]|uniref:hypothetical protein n=1 Tax=Azospirillum brasilense TaxID=192 RepID=UPI0011783016|nr:hypothetical protein [Azospirillum brasilense]
MNWACGPRCAPTTPSSAPCHRLKRCWSAWRPWNAASSRRRGPSREITVCFNVYGNTPGGDRFLSLLGSCIGQFLAGAEVYWMLDQMAHYVRSTG